MNVFCCLREDQHLLLGIPSNLEWSIKASPSEAGSVLTLQINGANEISLLGGNPVDLSAQIIEIKDYNKAYPDIIGPAQYLDVSKISDDISYFEVGRYSQNSEATDVSDTVVEQQPKMDRAAFYKWSQILAKLEEHFGSVTVSAWLDDAMVVEFTENTLKIEVGSDFRCEVIKKRCLDHIQNALMELFGAKTKIEVYAAQNK